MRLVKFLAPVAAVLAIAGCGGGSSHHRTTGSPAPSQCTPSNESMACVLRNVGKPRFGVAPTQSVVANGIDFAWGCPSPRGYSFGASYLSNSSKDWTSSCLGTWHRAGAKTVLVWETSGTTVLGGFGAGASDARNANAEAIRLGEPRAKIYFAIDFDASGSQQAVINSYYRGVASEIGVARTGAYGGYWPISRLFNARLIKYGWQTYAWSSGLWDKRAQLQQYNNASTVDFDRATAADYAQWGYVAPPPPPPGPAAAQLKVMLNTRFPSKWGNLNERQTVEQLLGAWAQRHKYRGYLRGKLHDELTFLAGRIWVVACADKRLGEFNLPCTWAPFDRGSREQFLLHDAAWAAKA